MRGKRKAIKKRILFGCIAAGVVFVLLPWQALSLVKKQIQGAYQTAYCRGSKQMHVSTLPLRIFSYFPGWKDAADDLAYELVHSLAKSIRECNFPSAQFQRLPEVVQRSQALLAEISDQEQRDRARYDLEETLFRYGADRLMLDWHRDVPGGKYVGYRAGTLILHGKLDHASALYAQKQTLRSPAILDVQNWPQLGDKWSSHCFAKQAGISRRLYAHLDAVYRDEKKSRMRGGTLGKWFALLHGCHESTPQQHAQRVFRWLKQHPLSKDDVTMCDVEALRTELAAVLPHHNPHPKEACRGDLKLGGVAKLECSAA